MNAQPNAQWTARSNIDGVNVVPRDFQSSWAADSGAPEAQGGGSHIVQPGLPSSLCVNRGATRTAPRTWSPRPRRLEHGSSGRTLGSTSCGPRAWPFGSWPRSPWPGRGQVDDLLRLGQLLRARRRRAAHAPYLTATWQRDAAPGRVRTHCQVDGSSVRARAHLPPCRS
jgi:hypothetical protein